jgi:3',5'-cyclic AMP phosphodiesterase CpdA
MPPRFAHISDPHLTSLDQASPRQLLNKRLLGYISWRRKRRAEHQTGVLQALQSDLETEELVQLVITGDLTHIGLPQEFTQAASWLQQLGNPNDIAVVPGNHDACVKMPWKDGLAHWQAFMNSDDTSDPGFPSLRVRQGIAFIGLSSACATPPLMASGTLGKEQLSGLASTLKQTAEAGLFRVVYLHHPPLPGTEKWRKRLTDAPELSDIIKQQGAELILHGHGHRAQQHELETCDGKVLVAAVPSASALGLHGADTAAYSNYAVINGTEGWILDIQERRYQPEQDTFTAHASQQRHIVRKHYRVK